jgi:hypothetical protein
LLLTRHLVPGHVRACHFNPPPLDNFPLMV